MQALGRIMRACDITWSYISLLDLKQSIVLYLMGRWDTCALILFFSPVPSFAAAEWKVSLWLRDHAMIYQKHI